MSEFNDRELLEDLGIALESKPAAARTPREERIIAGFEDILKFVDEHGHAPRHGEDRDIFERLYAVRLDRIRAQADCRALVEPLDKYGLLAASGVSEDASEFVDDASLLADLGVAPAEDDISVLRHVKSRAEITAAEEIAQRQRCADFDQFRPLFDAVRRDLDTGSRQARRFGENATIRQGEFFILGGQIAFVAAVPVEMTTTEHGHAQGRLRIIYDNGTEGDNLLRSFQRALYKDESGRRITEPGAGPLFGADAAGDDLESGTIYVLRSKSEDPYVAAHRQLIHKIGVTGGAVETRIAQAATDATYLLAEVDIVATYKLFNINRTRLENLLHRIFAPARLELTISDRFGSPVQPREWYLVPLKVIDETVDKVRDGSITGYRYDPGAASLVRIESPK